MRNSEEIPRRQGSIYVFGAGFTRAFSENAPLLVDAFPLHDIIKKYRHFPYIHALLEDACRNPDRVDIERLLTRLSEKMPYDDDATVRALTAAYSDVVILLRDMLDQAIKNSTDWIPLCKFAEAFESVSGYIITFNYDDLIERVFMHLASERNYANGYFWNPTWGYGFHAPSAEFAVTGQKHLFHDIMTRHIYKLHGSVNWRTIKGTQHPVPLNALVTWQDWCHDLDNNDPDLRDRVALHLDDQPIIIAPVLSKGSLLAEPIIQIVWKSAYEALRHANHITFAGYSLPKTDVAATYLFSESTRGIDNANIKVIDFFPPEKRDSESYLRHKLSVIDNYRTLFPDINEEQFDFDGARAWVEEFYSAHQSRIIKK